jgi:hypothetical protein
MRLSISTTGTFKPKCIGGDSEVKYRLLTAEQLETVLRLPAEKTQFNQIWRLSVVSIDGDEEPLFDVDGMEKRIPVGKLPDYPSTYALILEVSQHVLMDSALTSQEKKSPDSFSA